MAEFYDSAVVPFFEWAIAGVAGFVVAGVVFGIVTADEGPARIAAFVWVGTVEQVGVEKEGCAGGHFAIDAFEVLFGEGDTIWVGSGLCAVFAVFDAAEFVRTFENLEAAVVFVGAIDGDHAAGHVGVEAVVVVPVAIILVPFPGTTNARLFDHHFVVVEVDFVVHEFFHGIDYAVAVADGVIDVFTIRFRGEPEFAFATFGVEGCADFVGFFLVGFADVEEVGHFFGVV